MSPTEPDWPQHKMTLDSGTLQVETPHGLILISVMKSLGTGVYVYDDKKDNPIATVDLKLRKVYLPTDPLCTRCGEEQSHLRHHSGQLYNYHEFEGPPA